MKMHIKRFISVLLALTIVFAVCPFAYAEMETLACGHNDYDVTIEERKPTCELYGYTEQRECNLCTYVQKAQYIPETGHNYVLNKSSADKSGALKVCANCGDSYRVAHKSWITYFLGKEPTCTEDGYTTDRECTECGYHEVSEFLPALNHKYKLVSADGEKHTVKCENCSEIIKDEKHDIVFVYDKGYNCYSENATGKKVCRVCNEVLEGDIKLAGNEHHQNVLTEDKGAYERQVCQDCQHVEVAVKDTKCVCGNEVSAETYIVKQPSCDNAGYIAYNCSQCQNQERIPVAKFGHLLNEDYFIIQHATCQQTGIRGKKCYRCDYVEKIDDGKVGHLYIVLEEGVDVTCETSGISDSLYCTYCYDFVDHAVIPATGHTLIDYNGRPFCTTCYKYLIETEGGEVSCKCLCHNNDGFAQKIFGFILFFAKLFGFMQGCDCGAVHYVK